MAESRLKPETGAAAATAARLAVVGCGNPLAGDDSFGIEFVERLRRGGASGCALLTTPDAGTELLDTFQQSEVVLFADAVNAGWPAGTLHLVPLPWPGLESRGLAALSNHGWSIGEITRLARSLGRRLPRLLLLGAELEDVAPGAPRSRAVEKALERAVAAFPQILSLIENPEATVWRWPRHFAPGDAGFPGGV